MATDAPRQCVPLTCHGHSRPVPHISFSALTDEGTYFMISACKDGNPMLRDGITGDWIGTFIGHKGAVWQARLSHDASVAATASADFTAKVWDTHSGECLWTLQHDHIKKLRIFDLTDSPKPVNGTDAPATKTVSTSMAFEIGAGIHTANIKFIVWTQDPNVLVTASGNTLRWFDLPSRRVIKEEALDGEIGSCEFFAPAHKIREQSDIGQGLPVLGVAAGKSVYFWGGMRATEELKRQKMDYTVASVAIDTKDKKFIVGEDIPATWARVYRWDDGSELDIHKGHHGPVWSIAYAPDNKLYATGSEDGTIKLWKNCDGSYGLWRQNGATGDAKGAE
ncbi:hypothetical protein PG999_007869 [Apiospora kogelbergensis]|uniref:Serine-threonine kinase receptor-associated protein n=1 Tax=Apiospora kogelbergensis TaxID=1337665 RepID=A0AAW0QMC1_9PEZI